MRATSDRRAIRLRRIGKTGIPQIGPPVLPADASKKNHSVVFSVLEERAYFHLVYRLIARVVLFLAVDGAAHTNPRWQALALASMVVDVALWTGLRRSRRFFLVPRLALDAVDLAIWSLGPSAFYDASVLVGLPLACEAGIRLRLRGLCVPAVNLAAACVARTLAGRALLPFTVSWQVIGVLTGVAIVLYDARHQALSEFAWQQEGAALRDQAFLAGQNSVAMGADSVCDGLLGLAPRFRSVEYGSALYTLLDSWKAKLRERTGRQAAYLGYALAVWRKLRNLQPVLARDVEIDLPEGEGTVLLTGRQAQWLVAELERRKLRGDVAFEVVGPSADRLPGAPLDLMVNGAPLHLRADRRGRRAFDPAPILILIGISWMYQSTRPSGPFVPVGAVAPSVVLLCVAALWAHRLLRQLGRAARPAILRSLIAIAMLNAILATTTMRHPMSGGNVQFPAWVGMGTLSLLAGFYWCRLDRSVREQVIQGWVMVFCTGLVLLPVGLQLQGLALAMAWQTATFLPAVRLGKAFDAAGAALDAQLRTGQEAMEADAFQDGRRWVVDLVAAAVADARKLSGTGRRDADPDLDADTEHRLGEVEIRLRRMAAAD